MLQLAEKSALTDHEVLEVSIALAFLGFVRVANGDIGVTALGQQLVAADHAKRQVILGK